MKILHLINSTYQVVDLEETSVFFQGSISDCQSYINIKTTENEHNQ